MAITMLNEQNVESMLSESTAILYKHSPTCSISAAAKREIDAFVQANAAIPVYQVDVIDQRPLSQEFARKFNIRHESPQAILLQGGTPVWNDSHRRVTVASLEGAVSELS